MPSTPPKKTFAWNEIHKHRSAEDCWIVVDGKVYDVTSWVDKHPGGDLILQGAGREATPLFKSYHPTKVYPVLQKYEIGEVQDYSPYYTWESEFYSVLKRRVEDHISKNKIANDAPSMYIKTFLLLSFWAATYYLGLVRGNFLLAIMFGFLHSHLGISIAHDGAHGSYSRNKYINFLAKFAIDIMGGSWVVWSMQHNVGHHPHSNRQGDFEDEDFDPDARSGFPMVRLTPHWIHRAYHRFQHLYIWFLFGFVGMKWMYGDIKYFIKEKYQTMDFWALSKRHFHVQLATKAFFFAYAVALPIYLHGFSTGVALSLSVFFVTSYNFSLMFAVNHLTDESIFPHQKDAEKDWAKLQVLTSSNYATNSAFWTLLSGGLNFQIEHHLFPYVSHVHLSGIAPIVKQTCKQYDVRYQCFATYFDAITSYYEHLKRMGNPTAEEKTKLQ
eukprot:TRINITY_DN932_c0_g1_i1.p1 TRINITY_DN932_c0_g1~~TRINITY_DN932_c0_g1_i1.p1  ORF type:complete len:441 (-),score=75.43 TRINITY_DN932_c0_g1_i1:60-1382(-)